MDIAELREAAGLTAEQLPDDATPEQVTEAMRLPVAVKPEPEKDEDEVPTPKEDEVPEPIAAKAALPEGVVAIDAEEYKTLKAGAQAGLTLASEKATKDRDDAIRAAIKAGKFAPSRKAHYEGAWEKDPEGTKQLLTASADDGGLAENLVPVSARAVAPQENGPGAADNQGTGLFPTLAKREG